MTTPDFSALQPLIGAQEVNGRNVQVTFRCPQTGTEVEATAPVQLDTGVAGQAKRSAKKGMWASLRRSVLSSVSSALGSGVAGRVARDVVNTAAKQQEMKTQFSKTEVEAAVVAAFESVQTKFRADSQGGWVAVTEPQTAFAKRLAENPVTGTYDQSVLARALVELSAADGEISDEEKAMLADFIDPSLGTIDELAQRTALTARELAETDEGARGSILMLAWATAMSDEELADEELARLGQLAEGLNIDADTATGLRGDAQQFIFEQGLAGVYAGGSQDAGAMTELMTAASKMGIDAETAESFDVGYRKRNGIA